ncbi:hypothetical protein RD792_011664 [Penstemon davidsonii]|uniref:Uncharacterized protein n=1 Tax=Penstemon davidsonii TaxID=160366 RepID=A0ABR0CUQ6_9LAMI|nr:hypothetical protein RD792_011664 [Penstemon davidsonii]
MSQQPATTDLSLEQAFFQHDSKPSIDSKIINDYETGKSRGFRYLSPVEAAVDFVDLVVMAVEADIVKEVEDTVDVAVDMAVKEAVVMVVTVATLPRVVMEEMFWRKRSI